jgi:hypothetical protein
MLQSLPLLARVTQWPEPGRAACRRAGGGRDCHEQGLVDTTRRPLRHDLFGTGIAKEIPLPAAAIVSYTAAFRNTPFLICGFDISCDLTYHTTHGRQDAWSGPRVVLDQGSQFGFC